MNLAERLIRLRKVNNLSQEEVAERLGVSRQTVSKWETNQNTPDLDKIVPICELYHVSTEELLTGEKGGHNDSRDEDDYDHSDHMGPRQDEVFKRGHRKHDSQEDEVLGAIRGVIALITTIIYLFVSFMTHAWHITWIIWLVFALIMSIIQLVDLLKRDGRHEK